LRPRTWCSTKKHLKRSRRGIEPTHRTGEDTGGGETTQPIERSIPLWAGGLCRRFDPAHGTKGRCAIPRTA
jgi:hypothetical protein